MSRPFFLYLETDTRFGEDERKPMESVYVDFKRLRASQNLDRKLWREFHCACCRDIWTYISSDRSRGAVDSADRFTKHLESAIELKKAYDAAKSFEEDAWNVVKLLRQKSDSNEWIWPISAACDHAWVNYCAASAAATCALEAKDEILFTTLPESAASVRPWANARMEIESRNLICTDAERRHLVLERWNSINKEEDLRFSQLLFELALQ